jgi:hypothetical protein
LYLLTVRLFNDTISTKDITGRWLLIGSRKGYGNKRQWRISNYIPEFTCDYSLLGYLKTLFLFLATEIMVST